MRTHGIVIKSLAAGRLGTGQAIKPAATAWSSRKQHTQKTGEQTEKRARHQRCVL